MLATYGRSVVSPSTNKTDCYDITEILLKVMLNTITLTLTCLFYYSHFYCGVTVICCLALNIAFLHVHVYITDWSTSKKVHKKKIHNIWRREDDDRMTVFALDNYTWLYNDYPCNTPYNNNILNGLWIKTVLICAICKYVFD